MVVPSTEYRKATVYYRQSRTLRHILAMRPSPLTFWIQNQSQTTVLRGHHHKTHAIWLTYRAEIHTHIQTDSTTSSRESYMPIYPI